MSNIKVGDLVMTVRGYHCCGNGLLGITSYVESIQQQSGRCPYCKTPNSTYTARLVGQDGSIGYPVYRLIKIDPPSLPESIEHEKEISV